MMLLLSPTGKGIRVDPAGDGHYGTPRGNRTHKGTDFLCDVGQEVWSPINGRTVRKSFPYDDMSYNGIIIAGSWCLVVLWYLNPFVGNGVEVYRGQPVGIAEDVSLRYPGQGMLAHIHMEIKDLSRNPEHYMI